MYICMHIYTDTPLNTSISISVSIYIFKTRSLYWYFRFQSSITRFILILLFSFVSALLWHWQSFIIQNDSFCLEPEGIYSEYNISEILSLLLLFFPFNILVFIGETSLFQFGSLFRTYPLPHIHTYTHSLSILYT